MSIDDIIEVTGLSEQQIKELTVGSTSSFFPNIHTPSGAGH
jgi:hypothetical protein